MDRLGFVFDLDDTLYPERDYVRSAFRWIASALGEADIFASMWRRFEAGESDPIGALALERQLTTVQKTSLVAAMRAHEPDLVLDAGAAALLAALRSAGSKFAIITNGRSVTQRRKIAALGVEDAAAILISEETGAAKPDPLMYRLAANRCGAARHLYVGDNPAIDFAAPNALGWMTAMIERQDGVRRETDEPSAAQRPQRVIGSLADLLPLV